MTPEAKARQLIDQKLEQAGWVIQDTRQLNLGAAPGVAVREYPTDTGPADYVLFVNRQAVGIIEAKRDEAGENITAVELQTERYAHSMLKWCKDNTPLPFLFESTGQIIRFTDGRDPYPRSRELFHFYRPEQLAEWFSEPDTLRRRLLNNMPELPDPQPARLPDQCRHRLGKVARGKSPPRAHPHGYRRGQNLHRHHCRVSPAQVRQRPTRAVSGGHA